MSTPRMSLVIPAYQAERHLLATLHSAVAQDVEDLEILVLDNASTDRTAAIVAGVRDPRIRLERNPRTLPLVENWNRAVELSRGELVKLVCADDLVHPHALRMQAEVLDSDPAIALVASRRHMIDDDGRLLGANRGLRGLLGRHDGRSVAAHVVRSGANPIGEPGNVMFRRRTFDATRGFDGELMFPMDLVLWMELAAHGDFVGMPQSLAAFRAGAYSISAQRSSRQYHEQQQLTRRIAADPRWRLGPVDRLVGQTMAPLARARREVLFLTAGRARHQTLSRMMASDETRWLATV